MQAALAIVISQMGSFLGKSRNGDTLLELDSATNEAACFEAMMPGPLHLHSEIAPPATLLPCVRGAVQAIVARIIHQAEWFPSICDQRGNCRARRRTRDLNAVRSR